MLQKPIVNSPSFLRGKWTGEQLEGFLSHHQISNKEFSVRIEPVICRSVKIFTSYLLPYMHTHNLVLK